MFLSSLWIGSFIVVRNRVAEDSTTLADMANFVNSLAMLDLAEERYESESKNLAGTVDAVLDKYMTYMADSSCYAHDLY